MNNKQILEADAAASPYAQVFSDVDGFPAMAVQYNPDEGTGGTAATCQVTSATKLTFQVDAANPAGADAIGDASGDVAFATYTTMGALKDYIDGQRAWSAYLIGSLRADASASKLLTAAATSCIGAEGYTIYQDASATKFVSFAISGERFISNALSGRITDAIGSKGGYRNSMMSGSINAGLTGTSPQIAFYFEKQQGTTVQTAHSLVMADDTLEEMGVANPTVPYLIAPLGYRLIGRVSVGTTVDDIAQFHILGKSASLTGAYHVTKQNWPA